VKDDAYFNTLSAFLEAQDAQHSFVESAGRLNDVIVDVINGGIEGDSGAEIRMTDRSPRIGDLRVSEASSVG
jgi:hypothetical protein